MSLVAASLDRFAQPGQWWLALASLACGIALIVGIELARSSAVAALQAGEAQLDGGASRQLLPIDGRIDIKQTTRLAAQVDILAPIQQAWVTAQDGAVGNCVALTLRPKRPFRLGPGQNVSATSNDIDLRQGILAPHTWGSR